MTAALPQDVTPADLEHFVGFACYDCQATD
jgi:hypothetical protein